jgi:hypothetical protein
MLGGLVVVNQFHACSARTLTETFSWRAVCWGWLLADMGNGKSAHQTRPRIEDRG